MLATFKQKLKNAFIQKNKSENKVLKKCTQGQTKALKF
jgi:hypothetical protein